MPLPIATVKILVHGPVVPVILATMLSSNRAKSKKPSTRDVATDLHYIATSWRGLWASLSQMPKREQQKSDLYIHAVCSDIYLNRT